MYISKKWYCHDCKEAFELPYGSHDRKEEIEILNKIHKGHNTGLFCDDYSYAMSNFDYDFDYEDDGSETEALKLAVKEYEELYEKVKLYSLIEEAVCGYKTAKRWERCEYKVNDIILKNKKDTFALLEKILDENKEIDIKLRKSYKIITGEFV